MSDNPTPRASTPQTVIDALGRTLTIREIGPMEQIDLFEAAGDQSNNSPWVGMAILAASVTDIDGIPMPAPRSKNNIRAALKTLGTEGVAAVAKALRPSVPEETTDDVAIAKN